MKIYPIRSLFHLCLMGLFLGSTAHADDFVVNGGKYQITVQGERYSESSRYPQDSKGKGLRANALDSYYIQCGYIEGKMEAFSGAKIKSFRCAEPKNISDVPSEVQFQGTASFDVDARALKIIEVGKVDTGNVRVNGSDWAGAREKARNAYINRCAIAEEDIFDDYGTDYVIFDCGLAKGEEKRKAWRYSSQAIAIVKSKPVPPKKCSNGKESGERWYKPSSETVREAAFCQFGGSKTDVYKKDIEYLCQNGKTVKTGGYR
ncbi:MAG: hypothetical protein AAF203_10890, partial [Pseudomonadota bacterium]